MKAVNGSAKNLLLTGATGMLGGELVFTLIKQGWHIVALVRGDTKRLIKRLRQSKHYNTNLLGHITILRGDLMHSHETWDVFEGCINSVVHCACDTRFNIGKSLSHPNIVAYNNLKNYVDVFAKSARIIFYSTAYVNSQTDTYIEEDTTGSEDGYENGYLYSKKIIEQRIKIDFCDWLIIRPSIILSEGINNKKFALSMLWVFPLLSEIGWILANPKSKVDVVTVSFVCEATADIIDRHESQKDWGAVYHVSAGKDSNTLEEIVETLTPVLNRLKKLDYISEENVQNLELELNEINLRRYKSIQYYLPFLSGNIVYSNSKLKGLIGQIDVIQAKDYILDLIKVIKVCEADKESVNP